METSSASGLSRAAERPVIARSVAAYSAVTLTALVYLLTPTVDYFWDGITFALQIERAATSARYELLFHQNHLLYNAFGYVLYASSHALGLKLRALPLLQA